jgi:hypothetical protein
MFSLLDYRYSSNKLACRLKIRADLSYSFNGPNYNPNRFFSWFLPTLAITEEWMFENIGLDALMYLKFLKTSTKLFLFSSTVISFILTPLYAWGNGDQDPKQGLDRLTVANLPTGSSMLALPCIFTWYMTFLTFYLFHETYTDYVRLRIQYLKRAIARGENHLKTVMIIGLPKAFRDEGTLVEYFDSMGLGKVKRASVLRKTAKLQRVLLKREQHLRALEWSVIQTGKQFYEKEPQRRLSDVEAAKDSAAISTPPTTLKPGLLQKVRKALGLATTEPAPFNWSLVLGDAQVIQEHQPMYSQGVFSSEPPVPAVAHFYTKFLNRDEQARRMLDEARNDHHSMKCSHIAFVTFESYISATLLSRAVINPDPFIMVTRPAPEPRDILWKNIIVHAKKKMLRRAIANSVFVLITICWTIPLIFVLSLANVELIKRAVPFLGEIISSFSPVTQSILTSLAPASVYTLFMAILPVIISGTTIVVLLSWCLICAPP